MAKTMDRIQEIYDYRQMILSTVHRDLRGRYKGSVLGFMWTFLNPLFQLLVYTLLFSVIMRSNIEDYYLHLFVALVPWIFFSTCMSEGSGCIRDSEGIVKKIYFPREVIPISYVTSQFVNMLFCFIVVFLALWVDGRFKNPMVYVYLPLIMIIEYAMALGFTLILCAWNVYLRDVRYIMGILCMAWQFLTPVMYSVDQLPQNLIKVFYINPMTSVIVAYRDILFYQQTPELDTLGIACAMGVLSLVFGWFLFDKLQRGFAEQM